MSKKTTATDEIIQYLAEQIVSNKLRPNDKLPNERELAERFGVARGHVREALRGLSTVGLIEVRSGQGSFVTEPSERMKTEAVAWLFHPPHTTFSELYEAREVVEQTIYLKAFDYCNNKDINELAKCYQDIETAAKSKDSEQYADAIDAFDMLIANMTHNPLLIRLMQVMLYLRRDAVVRVLKLAGSMDNSLRLRDAVYQAFVSKDKAQVLLAVTNFYSESKEPVNSL